jgi:hypothetical protein
MANEQMFTRRDGKQVPVEPYTLSAADMTSLMRLQEDFAERGEHLSMKGVILHVIGKGIITTRNYWTAIGKNKDRRDFAKSAASCFNADGSIRDAEGLMKLAIAKGIVKGTPKQVPQPVEEELAVEELTVEELEAATAPVPSEV